MVILIRNGKATPRIADTRSRFFHFEWEGPYLFSQWQWENICKTRPIEYTKWYSKLKKWLKSVQGWPRYKPKGMALLIRNEKNDSAYRRYGESFWVIWPWPRPSGNPEPVCGLNLPSGTAQQGEGWHQPATCVHRGIIHKERNPESKSEIFFHKDCIFSLFSAINLSAKTIKTSDPWNKLRVWNMCQNSLRNLSVCGRGDYGRRPRALDIPLCVLFPDG